MPRRSAPAARPADWHSRSRVAYRWTRGPVGAPRRDPGSGDDGGSTLRSIPTQDPGRDGGAPRRRGRGLTWGVLAAGLRALHGKAVGRVEGFVFAGHLDCANRPRQVERQAPGDGGSPGRNVPHSLVARAVVGQNGDTEVDERREDGRSFQVDDHDGRSGRGRSAMRQRTSSGEVETSAVHGLSTARVCPRRAALS